MFALLFFLLILPLNALIGVYVERKLSAFIQDRLGPLYTGRYGFLQTVADIIKLLQKEDIKPTAADKYLFKMAPSVVFMIVFACFAVFPFAPQAQGAQLNLAIFYILSILSLDVIGMMLAGWGSNNKFAMYGAMRAVSQMVSYELPLGLSLLCVVIANNSMDLQEIVHLQSLHQEPSYSGLAWAKWGGLFAWNIFQYPLLLLVFPIFLIAGLAQANRAPFDLPEAESELVAGFQTEYSGLRWAFLMLAEYGLMLLIALLAALLFLGGWASPLPNIGVVALDSWTSGTVGKISGFLWGFFWLFSKTIILILVQMWVRWTLPRLRADQLLRFCWKYLTPFGIVLVLLSALWRVFL
ncbi:MAG: NADH-quinone oxidoreductase subunit H [Bernardetiaceae bacterium]|nr:NADH-quinone oxidoreductase subunit H [Bernardetiaceae bacterium]